MQQGQFGRRGATLNGAATRELGSAANYSEPRDKPPHLNPDGSFNGWRRAILLVLTALVGIVWLESLLSGTALLTPINSTMLWVMRGLGAAAGLATGIVLWSRIVQQSSRIRATLAVLVSPLLFAVLFDGIAWRVADWAAFGFSRQAFTTAHYPIKYVSHGRKGRRDTIEIDPFGTGENADIPISDAQYDELWSNHDGLCAAVSQRRSPSGAIEILTDGEYTLHEPAPVEITPCIGGGRTSGRSTGSNPWSRTP
ncbi:MAG: hypothetical protein ACKOPG_06910 [Novosphingobium sp.]